MKFKLTLPFFIILLLTPFTFNAKATSETPKGNNWMSFLGDNRPLHFISMPGSHDAAALYNNTSSITGYVYTYAQTQEFSVSNQLDFGVRYLDIRCNYTGGEFKIYHGSTYQNQNFDDILKECQNFLRSNPSETIIMSIKQEKSNVGDNSYSQRFYEYVQDYPNLFYLDNTIPNLGDVRGKIVLVRRFISGDNFGINAYNSANKPSDNSVSYWPNNSEKRIVNLDGVPLYIQDYYKDLSNDLKLEMAKKTNELSMKEMNMTRDDRYLYFNFMTGQTGSGNKIKNVSDYMNPKILSYYSEPKHQNSYQGIVIMDFVTAQLAKTIYMTNFNNKP